MGSFFPPRTVDLWGHGQCFQGACTIASGRGPVTYRKPKTGGAWSRITTTETTAFASALPANAISMEDGGAAAEEVEIDLNKTALGLSIRFGLHFSRSPHNCPDTTPTIIDITTSPLRHADPHNFTATPRAYNNDAAARNDNDSKAMMLQWSTLMTAAGQHGWQQKGKINDDDKQGNINYDKQGDTNSGRVTLTIVARQHQQGQQGNIE
ncbi:hypothetical protein EDB89DRAFT_2247804 [Lactarius sanguifluus]|nr:hypothetical protein EDB89DRAFT_2247804 [Lactarius sanguifluus]